MSVTDGWDWIGRKRRDGVTIAPMASGDRWKIVCTDGTEITECWCCDKDFPTSEIARTVADHALPLDGRKSPFTLMTTT